MTRQKYKLTNFGKAVKKKSISKEMTLTEVAEKAGTSLAYLNLIIYGRRSGIKHRRKICEVLGMDVNKYTA